MFASLIRFMTRAIAAAVIISAAATAASAEPSGDGIVRVESAYSFDDTVARLKKDVADKGIMYFFTVDQQKLAADAGIELHPSTLLVFGNPPLGSQFLTSNPNAGIDWPVRLLVQQDDAGRVWAVYTDFNYIARRHHISDREGAFKMASEVIASITGAVRKQ